MIDLTTYKMKHFNEYTLEELRNIIEETNHKRQHGKAGTENLDSEAERLRLYNNLASRVSRAKRRKGIEDKIKTYKTIVTGRDTIEDDDGITEKDKRRYRNCFNSGYIGLPVELDYVKRMTGLNDNQVYILQKETGLIPYPAAKKQIVNTVISQAKEAIR